MVLLRLFLLFPLLFLLLAFELLLLALLLRIIIGPPLVDPVAGLIFSPVDLLFLHGERVALRQDTLFLIGNAVQNILRFALQRPQFGALLIQGALRFGEIGPVLLNLRFLRRNPLHLFLEAIDQCDVMLRNAAEQIGLIGQIHYILGT